MKYLKNAWYVAGFADELTFDGKPAMVSRTLLEEPVLFFRDAQGAASAIADRCSHRFAPLSHGVLESDRVRCPYHGLEFDAKGHCVHNPHGDGSIPKAAHVRSYPVQERDGLLWFWPGDPAKADPTLLPDYSFAPEAHPDATIRGYMPTRCDYQLLVDNILDLTHADYVHAGALGSGALTSTKPTVLDLGERRLRVSWLCSGELAPHALDIHLKQQGQPTDQWTEVDWTAPSCMLLHVGATLVGEPREQGVDTFNLHLATPECDGHTHYWYWSTRNMAIDPESNKFITGIVENAFRNQDKPMLEAQQQRIGQAEFWSLKPVLLPGDAGAVRARRKLGALIEAEVRQTGA